MERLGPQHATPLSFTRYLHASIPITGAMGIEAREIEPVVRLAMPLAPNGNHYGSAFGGSLAALLTAAAWARATLSLEPGRTVVVASSEIRYLAPARAEVEAVCVGDVSEFALSAESGRARVRLAVEAFSEGVLVAKLEGLFVALERSPLV
ncbi:DUF4442 domain-containing protein [bacterium]|nr:MAG: DUF4442 domain-containing protein [bacterium]